MHFSFHYLDIGLWEGPSTGPPPDVVDTLPIDVQTVEYKDAEPAPLETQEPETLRKKFRKHHPEREEPFDDSAAQEAPASKKKVKKKKKKPKAGPGVSKYHPFMLTVVLRHFRASTFLIQNIQPEINQ